MPAHCFRLRPGQPSFKDFRGATKLKQFRLGLSHNLRTAGIEPSNEELINLEQILNK